MKNNAIEKLIEQYATLSGYSLNAVAEKSKQERSLPENANWLELFKLIGEQKGLFFELNFLPATIFEKLVESRKIPIIVFLKGSSTEGINSVVVASKSNEVGFQHIATVAEVNECGLAIPLPFDGENEALYCFLTAVEVTFSNAIGYSPWQRFWNYLRSEWVDIRAIYFYAALIAIVSLSLPLGIQSIIGLIAGGLMYESAVVLIILVVLATLFSGWLQVQQHSLVEVLQQRIFGKTAIQFAYRLPKLKQSVISSNYVPELVNRFFDVMNIQKSLSKVLVDFTFALLQIAFGLILLSFYHPYFIFSGLFVLLVIVGIFLIYNKQALATSLSESSAKYKLAFWLEEVGRTSAGLKFGGGRQISIQKASEHVNNYLGYRKKHFSVMITQFTAIIAFKTFVTGGLLLMGGFLVFNKQITLGQFVASEMVILLVLSAVEKLISNMPVLYDLLTAFYKIGSVLDLPEEPVGGYKRINANNRFSIQLKSCSFYSASTHAEVLQDVDFEIKEGDRVGVSGWDQEGKAMLLNALAFSHEPQTGKVCCQGALIQQFQLSELRSQVALVDSCDALFHGSLEENITLGNKQPGVKFLDEILAITGLDEFVKAQKEGLDFHLMPSGSNISSQLGSVILIARALYQQPKIVLINEVFDQLEPTNRRKLLLALFGHPTLGILVTSNLPDVLSHCKEIIQIEEGKLTSRASW